MISFFYFHDNWFIGDENYRNLNKVFQKLCCSPSKVPILTRIIPRNTIKRSRMLYQLLLTQNAQISIVFLSVKSIIMKIKEWYHVYLTPNISAKTWSNWTSRGGFEIVRWRWSMVIGYYSSFTLYHSKLLYFKSIMVKLNVIFF